MVEVREIKEERVMVTLGEAAGGWKVVVPAAPHTSQCPAQGCLWHTQPQLLLLGSSKVPELRVTKVLPTLVGHRQLLTAYL